MKRHSPGFEWLDGYGFIVVGVVMMGIGLWMMR